VHLHDKSREVCIKTRSTPASLPFKGQVTKQTTVKWSIVTFDSQYIILTHFIKRPNLAWSYSVARNDGGFFFGFDIQ